MRSGLRLSCFCLASLALLGGCSHRTAAGLRDWSQGLMTADEVRTVTVAGTVSDPGDQLLCSDFGDWLQEKDFTQIDCDVRRVVAAAGEGAPIFTYSGSLYPNWWNDIPGRSLGSRGKLPRGRWQLHMLKMSSPLLGGDVRIVLAARKAKKRQRLPARAAYSKAAIWPASARWKAGRDSQRAR